MVLRVWCAVCGAEWGRARGWQECDGAGRSVCASPRHCPAGHCAALTHRPLLLPGDSEAADRTVRTNRTGNAAYVQVQPRCRPTRVLRAGR
eukprot:3554831-Rhodomonas_salina.1